MHLRASYSGPIKKEASGNESASPAAALLADAQTLRWHVNQREESDGKIQTDRAGARTLVD